MSTVSFITVSNCFMVSLEECVSAGRLKSRYKQKSLGGTFIICIYVFDEEKCFLIPKELSADQNENF